VVFLGLVSLNLLGRALRARANADKSADETTIAQKDGAKPDETPGNEVTSTAANPPEKAPETKTPSRPAPPATKPIDLLALIQPKRDGVRGDWELRGGELLSPAPDNEPFKFKGGGAETSAVIEAPYDPPEEYDLTIVAEFERGRGPLVIGLPDRLGHWFVTLESPASVMRFLKSRKGPVPGPHFPARGTVEIKFQVRKDTREVFINDKPVKDPDGAMLAVLPIARSSEMANRQGVVIGSVAARYRISKLELTPLGEPGKAIH
jgi:hypothetical protein